MSEELKVALRAAEDAAAVLLRHFEIGVTTEWKGDRNPVSVADREAEAVVRAILHEAFPDDIVVGEEGAAASEGHVEGRRRWYVDPLDGTSNFVKGRPRWAVAIGFCGADDRMQAAVVHHPTAAETFAADLGEGATRNGEAIHASAVARLRDALLCIGPNAEDVIDVRGLWSAVLTGRVTGATALDLCDVACGRADVQAAARQGRWDLAAGSLIAREAGAVTWGPGLTPVEQPVDAMVACTPTLVDEVRAFLRCD